MQTADYNHNDFTNQNEADKNLMVKFFYKNVQNKMESQKQGRPIFKEKTYIEIRIAGQRDAQACRPVTHSDKQRFPKHFEAFTQRMEPPTEGVPLAEWAQISRSQAEELSFLHIKTVEQLATVKDGNMQNFMGGYALREKAQKWLVLNTAETVDREKEEMRETNAMLIDKLEKVEARLEALTAGVPNPLAGMNEPTVKDIPNGDPDLKSALDETPIEGAAIPVPAAPAGIPAKRRRKK
jgi:hypothetical protein